MGSESGEFTDQSSKVTSYSLGRVLVVFPFWESAEERTFNPCIVFESVGPVYNFSQNKN